MQTTGEKLSESQKLAKKEEEERQLLAKIQEQRVKSVSFFWRAKISSPCVVSSHLLSIFSFSTLLNILLTHFIIFSLTLIINHYSHLIFLVL